MRPPTDTTSGERARRRPPAVPGEGQRLGQGVAQGRHPELVLQRGQGVGEGLGHGAGTEDRTPTGVDRGQRGDGPALQQDRVAVVVDGPLDVLGAAEDAAGAGRQPGQLA